LPVIHVVDGRLNRSDIFGVFFKPEIFVTPLVKELVDRFLGTAVGELPSCEAMEAIDLVLSGHGFILRRFIVQHKRIP
jgi:hypothetical protein